MKIKIVLLAALLLVSAALLPLEELSMVAKYSMEGPETYEVNGSRSLHVGEVETREPEDVYTLYKPNKTYWTDDWYRQRKIEINSKGIREQEFSAEPDPDMTRVLFLGDSYTYGTGVNASDRYTDVIERKMRDQGRKIESINAGIAGAGIDGFAQYFRSRGKNYEPDLVVVSISSNDIWTRKQLYRYRQGIIEKNATLDHPINSTEQVYLNKKSLELKRQLYQESNGTELIDGLEKISRTADSPILVHGYYLREDHVETVKPWIKSRENMSYVSQSWKFSRLPQRTHLIPYDGHYNPVGHYWVAQNLIPEIRKLIE